MPRIIIAFGIVFIAVTTLRSADPKDSVPRSQPPIKGKLKASPRDADKRQEQELKNLSQKNLQMLMIALTDYEQAHGHFPPAVAMGPDGKTPRSWRVEILPFIRGGFSKKLGRPDHPYKDLHKQYKVDEPWDGPNNKKLLAKMPDYFRAPTDDKNSTNTSYFALVGKGAIFEGTRGVPVAEINDGSFTTVLLVESKPSVFWTKPDDIPFDPSKPLPKLGGVYKQGFFAVDAGGSRHFIPGDLKEAHLRALITRDGGEQYDFPK